MSDEEVLTPQPGRSDFVTDTSNVNWTLSSSQPWMTVTPLDGRRDGTLEILTAPNPGALRTGQVTLTSDSIAQPLVITVIQDGPVAITDASTGPGEFSLYPNPNTGEFSLDFRSLKTPGKKASVLDLNGRLVQAWILSGSQKLLNVEVNAAPGTYILRVETAAGTAYKKLLIH